MPDNNLPVGLTLINQRPVPAGLTLKSSTPAATEGSTPPKDISLARGVLDTGETALKSLVGLPATVYQELRHPIDSAVDIAKGVAQIPKAEIEAGKGEYGQIKEDVGAALDSNVSPYQRTLRGGRAALTSAGAIPNAVIGVPYAETFGKLAEKGSGGFVKPEEAAMLPMMAAGAGKGRATKLSDFGEASQRIGMDLSKTKTADAIANEITRATDAYNSKLVNQIAPKNPGLSTTDRLGDTGSSALSTFQKRKGVENKFWQAAEQRGNNLPYDAAQATKDLKDLREKTIERIAAGEDTPDVKKSKALIDRILGEIGSPASSTDPTRAATAGDLARAHRASNESLYSAADPAVHSEVKNILRSGLSEAAKNDKDFGKAWRKANTQTAKNADVYRTDKKAAQFGFDEDTLSRVGQKLKQNRPIAAEDLETINHGIDRIKTPEDVLFLQRTLRKPDFSMAMRAKAAAMLDDIGTNADKLEKGRPMLEKVMEAGGVDKKTIKTQLDDLQTVSKEMRKYDIPSRPEPSPEVSRTKQRVQAVTKAIMSFSPKYRLYHGIQAVAPSGAPAGNLALDAIRKQALPKPTTSALRNIPGPALGAFLSQQNGNNQQ